MRYTTNKSQERPAHDSRSPTIDTNWAFCVDVPLNTQSICVCTCLLRLHLCLNTPLLLHLYSKLPSLDVDWLIDVVNPSPLMLHTPLSQRSWHCCFISVANTSPLMLHLCDCLKFHPNALMLYHTYRHQKHFVFFTCVFVNGVFYCVLCFIVVV